MTKRKPLPITKCPLCGTSFNKGERVRVVFNWEYERTSTFKNSGDYKCATTKATSKCICRECGKRLADEVGVQVAGEVMGL